MAGFSDRGSSRAGRVRWRRTWPRVTRRLGLFLCREQGDRRARSTGGGRRSGRERGATRREVRPRVPLVAYYALRAARRAGAPRRTAVCRSPGRGVLRRIVSDADRAAGLYGADNLGLTVTSRTPRSHAWPHSI